MKRQMKSMYTWTQSLFLAGSMLFSSLSFAGTSDITLTWDVVSHATHYQIEKDVDGAWVIQTDQPISGNQITINDLESGEQKFRVSGCVEELDVAIHCGDAVADYAEGTFTLQDFLQRRVIFIHTDLLGSPAAETQGVSQ
ncbi:fibronectin type III domain-containing protein [Paraglaciecola arctica]|nr:fibronectin type III domain-containing protein [Paraglaciecola arctica]